MTGALRWSGIAALALLAALPFLFVQIPPLTDVPGHIGRFAVQEAPAGSPLFRYFGFHWALKLNLASDGFVAALYGALGLFASTWLACALVPVLTVAGLLTITRQLNPRGAFALPLALVFVYNYGFLWGFLNYALTAGLSLCSFAAWLALARKPRIRAVLFLLLPPALLVGHGVGGGLLILWIGSYELWKIGGWRPSNWRWATLRPLVLRLWPLGSALIPVLASGRASGLLKWYFLNKFEEIASMVRDQNIVLDIGTSVAVLIVFVTGWFWGARLRGGSAGPVIATALLFVAAPCVLGGASQIDLRIVPFVPMLALALQDWSDVRRDRRRRIALAGVTLLALRFGLITASFVVYDRSYANELTALKHVASGSRILNLSLVDCRASAWRSARREHIANLATPLRQAWVNAHWANDSINMLTVRYTPPGYTADPSHLIWPDACIDHSLRFDERERHTLAETMRVLPLDQADYLWLIGQRLPTGYVDPRLVKLWSYEQSELYAVRRIR